jgi:hypothetical protein
MSNDGVEFSLNGSYKFQNGLEVGLTANYSYAKNKVINITYDPNGTNIDPKLLKGKPYGTQFGLHSLGLFSTADDKNHDGVIDSLDGYKVIQFGAVRPGDVKYADINHDNKIDTKDITVIGNPTYPSSTFGFTPNATWKGFDLSLFFQGAAGASINIANFQSQPFSNNKSNTGYEYYNNYWMPNRQNATYPRLDAPLADNNTQFSDFWLRNSNYLRLKNLILGYKVPSKVLKYAGMKSFRVYFSGQNLYTFSKVKFIDPEEQVVPTASTYFYPLQKVYTFGVDVTF